MYGQDKIYIKQYGETLDDDVDQPKCQIIRFPCIYKLLNHVIIEQSAATLLKMDLSQSIDSILIFCVC